MGGTNTTQTATPTTTVSPTQGNLGAGASLMNSTVMPVDLAGSSGTNTVSITDVSPAVWTAAAATVNKAIDAVDLVTSGSLNLATSQAARASDLAAGSTGSGPYQGLISAAGKWIVGGLAVVVLGIALFFGLRKKKNKEGSNG